MNIIKKELFENLVNVTLQHLGDLSIKIAESSESKSCFGGAFYETEFPKELLELEKLK